MLEAIFAVLVYPGLVLTLVLGLIFGWLSERQTSASSAALSRG